MIYFQFIQFCLFLLYSMHGFLGVGEGFCIFAGENKRAVSWQCLQSGWRPREDPLQQIWEKKKKCLARKNDKSLVPDKM